MFNTGKVSSFADIQKYNLRFVQGLDKKIVYYGGSLEDCHPETMSSIPQLVQINQLGLSTQGSQPGRENERAYLVGLGTQQTAKRLYALNFQDIVVRHRRCDEPSPHSHSRIAVTWAAHGDNCATKVGNSCSCSTPAGPKDPDAKWFFTRVAGFGLLSSWNYFMTDGTKSKLEKNLYSICIVDPIWGRHATTPKTGLLDRVIQVLCKTAAVV